MFFLLIWSFLSINGLTTTRETVLKRDIIDYYVLPLFCISDLKYQIVVFLVSSAATKVIGVRVLIV